MTFPALFKRLTKGAPLTKEEGDANWAAIYAALSAMVPYKVAQSSAAVTRTAKNTTVDPNDDTDFAILASPVVTGGTMGESSRLIIAAHWDIVSPTGTKTLAMDWGGSNFSAPTFTTQGGIWIVTEIFNAGNLTNQKCLNSSIYGTTTTAVHSSLSKDTANDVTVDFKCKWSGATPITETITLLNYSIWHLPGD